MGFYNPPSGGGSITPGVTPIIGGVNMRLLYDDNGVIGEANSYTWDKTNKRATINGNAAALPTPATGTALQIGGADGVNNPIQMNGFGAPSQLIGTLANGTNAVPTGLLSGNAIIAVAARGYDGSGAYTTSNNAALVLQAAENWSGTGNHGTSLVLSLTPIGSGTLTSPVATFLSTGLSYIGTYTGTSSSALALAIGLNGATNPAFSVDASTASQVAGLKVTGAVTGGTVALVATDSGSNTNVTWNAKGSGTFSINATATGGITLGRATTITTGGLTVSAGDVAISASSGALTINGNVRLSNAGPGGVVAGQILFGTNVSTGANTSVLSFGGNIGAADGPLSTISGAVGGTTTRVGGELRLQGGISTAATGAGGAVTVYTAPAAAGTTPALVATFANDKSATFAGTIATPAPSGASAGLWKLGSLVAGAVVVDTTRSLFVDVGGVVYKLIVST